MREKLLIILLFAAPICSNFIVAGTILLQDVVLLIYIFLSIKTIRIRINSRVIFFFLSIFLSIFAILFIGLEHIRFIISLLVVLIFYFINDCNEVVSKSLRFGALFSSLYLILTLFLFLLFNVNISLDFGKYSLMSNTFSGIDSIGESSEIKLGGLFREPNWFAIYCSMGLYSFLKHKEYLKLSLVLFALLLANSSFGHLLIIVVILYLLYTTRSLTLFFVIGLSIFIFFSLLGVSFFERTLDAFSFSPDGTSSYGIRIYYPWLNYFDNVSMIPVSYRNSVFANTGIVVLSVFGFVGGIFFLIFLGYLSQFSLLYIFFLIAIILEGFYGRVEFAIYLYFLTNFTKFNSESNGQSIKLFVDRSSID